MQEAVKTVEAFLKNYIFVIFIELCLLLINVSCSMYICMISCLVMNIIFCGAGSSSSSLSSIPSVQVQDNFDNFWVSVCNTQKHYYHTQSLVLSPFTYCQELFYLPFGLFHQVSSFRLCQCCMEPFRMKDYYSYSVSVSIWKNASNYNVFHLFLKVKPW